MANESSPHITISIIHYGHYPKQIVRQGETGQSSPWSIYSNAESSNSYYISHYSKISSRMMNKKCSVSDPYFLKTN